MAKIAESVGIGGKNAASDVAVVRELLVRHKGWLSAATMVSSDGDFDAKLGEAITEFQREACSILKPDGRVDPKGFTLSRLNLTTIPKPKHKAFLLMCWSRSGPGLQEQDYKSAATLLGCELAAVKAVAEVEVSTRGAFESTDGRPTILFERHKFKKHTSGAYNVTHKDISGSYSARSYGKYRDQYPKLRRAAVLDETAALKSASWGAFQILGENFKDAGYDSVAAYVDAMLESEQKHLKAFVSFIQSNTTLLNAIRDKDWVAFAKGYNGPKYKDNDYDTKLADAYKKHAPAVKPAKSNAGETGSPSH